MALYLIRRHFPGARPEDLDAASLRSLACLAFHPGLAWVRTYWDASREETLCVYEARDPEQIRVHANRAAIPCDEITLVDEVLPERFFIGPATPVG